MASYTFTIEDAPRGEDVQVLSRGLTAHSLAYTQVPGFKPIGVFMRDEHGALVGGVDIPPGELPVLEPGDALRLVAAPPHIGAIPLVSAGRLTILGLRATPVPRRRRRPACRIGRASHRNFGWR